MKIFCPYTKMMPVAELAKVRHPSSTHIPSNPLTQAAADSLATSGVRSAIIVSKRSGYITWGEWWLDGALKLGCEQMPVDVQEYESNQAEIEHIATEGVVSRLMQPRLHP